MISKYNLVFHHIGCLTQDMEESKRIYAVAMGLEAVSETFNISSQCVKVCFITLANGTFLELIEPVGENPSLQKILKSKNPFYHLGFLTDDIDATIERMLNDGCYLVNTVYSEAYNNKKCAFIYTEEMHLIELIQK